MIDEDEEALKYPNLLKVNDMFWDTLEQINDENEYGALTIRAARNAMSDVLDSNQFWEMLEFGVGRRVKLTTDPKRAADKVQTCDKITELLTNQRLADRLPELVDLAYEFIVTMDLTLVQQVLTTANEIIKDGRVPNAIKMMTSVVKNTELDQAKVKKGFSTINTTLFFGGNNAFNPVNSAILSLGSSVGFRKS